MKYQSITRAAWPAGNSTYQDAGWGGCVELEYGEGGGRGGWHRLRPACHDAENLNLSHGATVDTCTPISHMTPLQFTHHWWHRGLQLWLCWVLVGRFVVP